MMFLLLYYKLLELNIDFEELHPSKKDKSFTNYTIEK